jgi:Protein of unknown function (DUF1552)
VRYQVSRRAFLSGLGGAFGLHILLRNLEAAAEGAQSPARLLNMFWPNGTMRQRFVPTGGRTDFQFSPILEPFETAGLREELIILYGLSLSTLRAPRGGSNESGTVFACTGVNSEGTRSNGGETDDTVAGGPSFDQILLKRSALLGGPNGRYINTICDERTWSNEISTRCLSYGYERELVPDNSAGLITQNIPLMPILKPSDAFLQLFSGFVPGGMEAAEFERKQRRRQSILDSSLRELTRLRTLAPASQRDKIDLHAEAIRKLEQQIAATPVPPAACELPSAPDAELFGKSGNVTSLWQKVYESDQGWLEQVGKTHLALIRAAFQCDLIRVATFMWCPANNSIAFEGMYSPDPTGAYPHSPTLMRKLSTAFWSGAPPAGEEDAGVYDFGCNVHTWFNQKTAEALVDFKNSQDAFGGSLLDHTVVPFITEQSEPADSRSPMPALIIGGRKLGMQGGQFVNLDPAVHHNSMWLTVAQAFFPDEDPTEVLADEAFMAPADAAPIEGLWERPV